MSNRFEEDRWIYNNILYFYLIRLAHCMKTIRVSVEVVCVCCEILFNFAISLIVVCFVV
jgi:hypothetical protein